MYVSIIPLFSDRSSVTVDEAKNWICPPSFNDIDLEVWQSPWPGRYKTFESWFEGTYAGYEIHPTIKTILTWYFRMPYWHKLKHSIDIDEGDVDLGYLEITIKEAKITLNTDISLDTAVSLIKEMVNPKYLDYVAQQD